MGITNSLKMVRGLVNQVRSASNPNALLNSMAEQNPQLKEIMTMVNSGKSPRDLFYAKAKEMGVDPEDIVRQLQQI